MEILEDVNKPYAPCNLPICEFIIASPESEVMSVGTANKSEVKK